MKLAGTCIALAALAGVALPAAANEGLAKKHNCLACHTVDKKMVGPSYKEVAAKYRADKDALTKLAAKIKNARGSGATYRCRRMPPCPTRT
jgi:cytochrome c